MPVEAIPIDRMRAPEAKGAGACAGPRLGPLWRPGVRRRHQATRTSSIVHGNGERASTTSPWRPSSRTNARLDQWLTCPGVLPSSRR